jgi:hypothetical protein
MLLNYTSSLQYACPWHCPRPPECAPHDPNVIFLSGFCIHVEILQDTGVECFGWVKINAEPSRTNPANRAIKDHHLLPSDECKSCKQSIVSELHQEIRFSLR